MSQILGLQALENDKSDLDFGMSSCSFFWC